VVRGGNGEKLKALLGFCASAPATQRKERGLLLSAAGHALVPSTAKLKKFKKYYPKKTKIKIISRKKKAEERRSGVGRTGWPERTSYPEWELGW
jgi:hypothetical protein